ncbi:hypothetical protein HO173_008379 [Letharia columbiana]|uniref:Uncharacterized protein n=1 Tax=Letharia columbiana TaxID=112416 RepID=A0A8H6L2W0_9LECA|nr:uncharacterized protein HO173_008379 [Letharia columbiana]KAF6233447.1 hypothetical protein HO173_008379 [Letharia columbiana]
MAEFQEAHEGPDLSDEMIEVPNGQGGFSEVQGPVQSEGEFIFPMATARDSLHRCQDDRWNRMLARMDQDAQGEKEDRADSSDEVEDGDGDDDGAKYA